MKSQRSLLMQRHLGSGLDDVTRTIMAKKTARKCSVRLELLFVIQSVPLLICLFSPSLWIVLSSPVPLSPKTILDMQQFCLKKRTKSTSAGTHTEAHNLSCVVTLHKTFARAVLTFDWLKWNNQLGEGITANQKARSTLSINTQNNNNKRFSNGTKVFVR